MIGRDGKSPFLPGCISYAVAFRCFCSRGVSLAFLIPDWPATGVIIAVIGVVGFIWYLKRGCATCPRNEGRCAFGEACEPTKMGDRKGDT